VTQPLPTWLDEGFGTLAGDENGVAHILATTVRSEGDGKVLCESQIGHVTTNTATPVDVAVFELEGSGQFRVDLVLTATTADGDKGGTWRFGVRLKRVGTTVTLITAGVDPGASFDDTLDASLDVDSGTSADHTGHLLLTVTGLGDNESPVAITWGWEARMQRQVI
jgi:hypothetical protein